MALLAEVAHDPTGCYVSLNDMADRASRMLADGEAIDLGGAGVCATSIPRMSPMAGTSG